MTGTAVPDPVFSPPPPAPNAPILSNLFSLQLAEPVESLALQNRELRQKIAKQRTKYRQRLQRLQMICDKIHAQQGYDHTEIKYSLSLAFNDVSDDEELRDGEGIRLEKVK